ncbi:MAG: nucleoid occlusion protein [Bacillota bacterium]|nr:nucleoid occlusion protein [Bacillota bacterium]
MVTNIPEAVFEPTTEKVVAIDINKIRPNQFQPRRNIDQEKIMELANSIKENGLIQPVVVRRDGNNYELVVGARRYLACRSLGWQKISAVVKYFSDSEMAVLALIENLQRVNLNCFEEAMGYSSIIDQFSMTQEQLANNIGKKQSTIANKIRLLKLSTGVRKEILAKGLSERHARALLKLHSEEEQIKMITEIANQELTVKEAEKRIIARVPQKKGKKRKINSIPVIRDMRIFLNTIREAVEMIKKSGLTPDVTEKVDEDCIEVTIRLTKEMVERK